MPKVVVVSGTQIIKELDVEVLTPREMVKVLHPETKEFPVPTLCIRQGKPLLRRFWDDYVDAQEVIVFSEAPLGGGGGGGGKNPLATILTLVVGVIATIVTGGVAGLIGGFLGKVIGGLAGAAVLFAGSMLIGALTPTPSIPSAQINSIQNEDISPTYSINAQTNRARLYQAEPEGFGRMKIIPDVVAQTYYRYIGNEFYLFAVYGCGRGEYLVEQLFFGDTIFWRDGQITDAAYQNVELEFIAEGGEVTLFPDNVETSPEVAGIELKPTGADGVRMGPYAANPPGSVTDTIVISYALSQGVWTIHPSSGAYIDHTVSFAFYYRMIDDNGNPTGEQIGTSVLKTITVDGVQAELVKFSGSISYYKPSLLDQHASYNILRVSENNEQNAFLIDGMLFVWVTIQRPAMQRWMVIPNVNTSNPVGNYTYGTYYDEPNLGIDLDFPQGSFEIITYEQVTDPTKPWLPPTSVPVTTTYNIQPFYETIYSTYAILFQKEITSNSRQPIRETQEIKVPLGRYEVAAEATFEGLNDGRTGEQIVWEQLFSVLPGTRSYPQSCIAVKIKADNVLSQEASQQFKIIQTRKLPLWENGAWSEPVPTSSLAAAISWVCKSDLGGKLTDRQIDLETLWAIDANLAEKGWEFNYWLDGSVLMWDLVNEWCSCCLVTPRLIGTVLSFVEDKQGRPVKYDITPYHIIRGTFAMSYITHTEDTPDDVIVEYLDRDYGYAQKDVRAALPTSESKEPSRRNIPYITNRSQGFWVAVHQSACNRWRRLEVTFDVGGVGRFMYVGDIFTLKHPRLNNYTTLPLMGYDSSLLEVYTENDVNKPISDNYYVGFSLPNGQLWGPCLCSIMGNVVKLDAGDYSALLSQGFANIFDKIILDRTDGLPTIMTVYTSKIVPERMIVKSVKPKDMYTFTINAMQDNENVYSYGDLEVPPLDYIGPTGGGNIAVGVPQGLSATIVRIGDVRTIELSWLPAVGALSYVVEYSKDDSSWIELGKPSINAATYTISTGVFYIRIKAVGAINTSNYAYLSGDTEAEAPPKPVVVLMSPYLNASLKLAWNNVDTATNYKIVVNDNEGNEVYSTATGAMSWEFTAAMQVDAGGAWRELTAYVSSINNYGQSAAGVISAIDNAPIINNNIQVTGLEDVITISGIAEGEDVTGFIVARVKSATLTGISDVIESKIVTELPVEFSGIDLSVVNYIAVAQKDGFFDVNGDILDLNYQVYSIGGEV